MGGRVAMLQCATGPRSRAVRPVEWERGARLRVAEAPDAARPRRDADGPGAYTGGAMRIGIMGMGYVGLPLAVALAEEGHNVVALDTDTRKIDALRAGQSYVEDISNERLRAIAERIEATKHTQPLARCDAVLICVPTPLTANREPDLGPLVSATRSLSGVLQSGQLVVVESTTYPGTTRERIAPLLEESGLVAGGGLFLAMSAARGGPRLSRRVLARARRSRPHGFHVAHDAEDRGRAHRRVRGAGGGVVRLGV